MSRAQQASDRAADWIIHRENEPWTPQDDARFAAWIAESDGNKAAYWRLRHSWKEADRIGALGATAAGPDDDAGQPAPSARWWQPVAVAAAIALVVGLGSGIEIMTSGHRLAATPAAAPASAAMFATPVGIRRVVGLADGSKVELNTASRMRTSITAASRQVWLEQGEAYFEVAHLNGRPFVVHAGNRTVTVVGTKFSVRRDGETVTVSVVEGRVRVAGAGNPSVPAAIISAGDVAIAQGPSSLFTEKSAERVENALAWRGGMLSFDQSPLSAVAAEFNRYNRKPIVVEGPEVANIRIGGTFPAGDPDAFVRLLHDAYGLHVENRDDAVIISG